MSMRHINLLINFLAHFRMKKNEAREDLNMGGTEVFPEHGMHKVIGSFETIKSTQT